jgi:hypothetical protein
MEDPRDHACVMFLVFPLQGVYGFKSPRHSQMSEGLIVVSKCSNGTFIMVTLV